MGTGAVPSHHPPAAKANPSAATTSPKARTLRRGFTGAKPDRFADWLRVLLGYMEGDTMHDMFPGSNAVTAVFDRLRLPL